MSERICMQGHPGCGYIGDAPHESSAPTPLTEARVREILHEEIRGVAHLLAIMRGCVATSSDSAKEAAEATSRTTDPKLA